MQMDTRFLETFLAVVDAGSIAAAARRLNLTSAAVAQRIRTLEEEIGFPLIMRNGRTVRTTEAGDAIVGRAREFLSQIRDLKTLPSMKAVAGQLLLGAISTTVTGFLPNVLSQLSVKHSGVELYIVPGPSAILYQQVLTGELDAALISRPPFDLPKTCDWKTFYREKLVLLKPSSLKGNDVKAHLAGNPFIRYHSRAWGGLLVDGYLRKIGVRPKERFELDALDAIAVLVDRGLGVALAPDWPPPWPAGLSLTRTPVGDPAFDRHVGLVWARATPRLRLVQAFLEEATASAARLVKDKKDRELNSDE
jgi:DNA-binding transcriptional LysR family regulator